MNQEGYHNESAQIHTGLASTDKHDQRSCDIPMEMLAQRDIGRKGCQWINTNFFCIQFSIVFGVALQWIQ